MLNIDLKATRDRINDRCVNLAGVARKYDINPRSMALYMHGKFTGKRGLGVYGRCEAALIDMGLLVVTVPDDDTPPAAEPAPEAAAPAPESKKRRGRSPKQSGVVA